MDLSIIIVNWNSTQYLRQCLLSLAQNTANVSYEIIVVDSGSFDGCDSMLRAEFAGVRFIQSETNVGFARANNLGFKVSRGEHLLFLNPDTELCSPAVDTLLAHSKALLNPGAVGCRLLNGDDSLQSTCVAPFPTILNQVLNVDFLRQRFPSWSLWGCASLFQTGDQSSQVEVVSGACLMVRRSAFERVGMFSDDYFMYAEDLDLCYKLARAGYTNHYVPQATVRHYGGASSAKAPSEFSVVMMRDSIWRFLRLSRGSLYGFGYRASTLAASIFRLVALAALWALDRVWCRPPERPYAFKKWLAILAWSLGLKTAVRPR